MPNDTHAPEPSARSATDRVRLGKPQADTDTDANTEEGNQRRDRAASENWFSHLTETWPNYCFYALSRISSRRNDNNWSGPDMNVDSAPLRARGLWWWVAQWVAPICPVPNQFILKCNLLAVVCARKLINSVDYCAKIQSDLFCCRAELSLKFINFLFIEILLWSIVIHILKLLPFQIRKLSDLYFCFWIRCGQSIRSSDYIITVILSLLILVAYRAFFVYYL